MIRSNLIKDEHLSTRSANTFGWPFVTEHAATLFLFSDSCKSGETSIWWRRGHSSWLRSKNYGPLSHRVYFKPSMSVPRDTKSVGFSSVGTCLQTTFSESSWISETLFPTNVDSVDKSLFIQYKVNCESDQKLILSNSKLFSKGHNLANWFCYKGEYSQFGSGTDIDAKAVCFTRCESVDLNSLITRKTDISGYGYLV